MQFSPNLVKDEPISFFSSEWGRSVTLDYMGSMDYYQGLETYTYHLSEKTWAKNPEMDSSIRGALNVTNMLGANAVVTKGRYLDID